MKLVQLKYFLKVVECHSISKAARELYISQPALSESIKAFESEMGSKIFDRSRKGVELTDQGKQIYQIVLNIQRDVDELNQFAINNKAIKVINIAVVPMVSGTIFLDIINQIYCKFPDIEIYPEELRPRELLGQLRNGQVDVALCSKRQEDEALFDTITSEMHLQHKKLLDVPLMVYVAKNNALAQRKSIAFAELTTIPCFILNDYKNYTTNVHEFVLSSRDIIFNAVAHDKGCTIMPRTASIGNNYFKSQQICAVPLAQPLTVPLEIIFPAENAMTPLLKDIYMIIEKTVLNNC